MSVFQALVLGIIQGITEFLPISSSGHLIFIPKIFNWADQGLGFDIMVHLGTLVAIIIYFRKRIVKILKGMLCSERMQNDKKLGWLLLLSIIPAGIAGLLFSNWIEVNLRSSLVIGISLIFWGLVLYWVEKKNQTVEKKSLTDVGWKQSLFIGCAQAIALIPGTSRSGITMTAGLFSKLDKKSAAEFSFLMSIPIIFLAGGLNVLDLMQNGLGDLNISVLFTGLIASSMSGFVAIWGLMKIIQKWSFKPFVVYRVVVGIIILIFLK